MKPIDKEEVKAIQTTIDKHVKNYATNSHYDNIDMNAAYVTLTKQPATIYIQYMNQTKENIYGFFLIKKGSKKGSTAVECLKWGTNPAVTIPNFTLVSDPFLKALTTAYTMGKVYSLAELNEVITSLRILKLEEIGII